MTAEDLQSLARGVAMLALVCGFAGALCFDVARGVCRLLGDYFERRADKAWRIREARWRAHWNNALREAQQSGYEGRRAIAYAANTMRTRKAAIAELEAL